MSNSRSGWLVAACGAGLVHVAASAYWALGGDWLASTIGQWAVDWRDRAPTTVMLVLSVIALAKGVAAVLPLLVESGRLPGRSILRAGSWLGAAALVGYGVVNAVVAWLVLSGLVEVSGSRDRDALLGHAALWDPLFAIWGGLLARGLWATRETSVMPAMASDVSPSGSA